MFNLTPEEQQFISDRRHEAKLDADRDGPSQIFTYTRCSHQDSVDSGVGFIEQDNVTKAYIKLLLARDPNLEVNETEFRDSAVSAWKHDLWNRPAGNKLRYAVRRGDHVVFARLDRAFRRFDDTVRVLQAWEKRGITVHFVDINADMSTPAGNLSVCIMATVAQMQAEYTSERNKANAAIKKKQGRPCNGSAPVGIRIIGPDGNRRYAPVEGDAARKLQHMGRMIVKLREEERLSWPNVELRLEKLVARTKGLKRLKQGDPDRWGRRRIRGAYDYMKWLEKGEEFCPKGMVTEASQIDSPDSDHP